jgi:hypothetical protein
VLFAQLWNVPQVRPSQLESEHTLFWHCPLAHTLPQVPQFCGSVLVSTQPLAHDFGLSVGQQAQRSLLAELKTARPISDSTIQANEAAMRWQPRCATPDLISVTGYEVSHAFMVQVAKSLLHLRKVEEQSSFPVISIFTLWLTGEPTYHSKDHGYRSIC